MYCIYKLTVGDDFYIGSTNNLNKRYYDHMHRAKQEKYNHIKLYKTIKENDYHFTIDILEFKECDGKSVYHLEQSYISSMKPTLNSYKAHLTIESKREQNRNRMKTKYHTMTDAEREVHDKKAHERYLKNRDKILEKGKEKIECKVCGCWVVKRAFTQHCKTIKHIKNCEKEID